MPQSDNAGFDADVDIGNTRRTAALGLVAKFKRMLQLTGEVYNTAVATIGRETEAIDKVRARVRSNGGAWDQALENELVAAIRRLGTASPDTVAALEQHMTAVANLVEQMGRKLDFDQYVPVDRELTHITKLPSATNFDIEAREGREVRDSRDAAANARELQEEHAAQRANEAMKTAAFNQTLRDADDARVARVALQAADAEAHNQTALVRAMTGR
jgi:hypothetical protein